VTSPGHRDRVRKRRALHAAVWRFGCSMAVGVLARRPLRVASRSPAEGRAGAPTHRARISSGQPGGKAGHPVSSPCLDRRRPGGPGRFPGANWCFPVLPGLARLPPCWDQIKESDKGMEGFPAW